MENMDPKRDGNSESFYDKAVGQPSPGLMAGFSASVFNRTTRAARGGEPWAGRRYALGALGAAAAAGVAGVLLYPREQEGGEEALELAEVELELLENLELCRELDLLEMLEALEEMENG